MDKHVDNYENRCQTGKDYFPGNENAAQRFDALVEELGGFDTLRPQHAILIADVVRNEDLKQQLREDIAKRGLGEMARNGRQTYWRENKSVSMLMKLTDQQRRTMQALGLIAKQKDQPEDPENDDGDFDNF